MECCRSDCDRDAVFEVADLVVEFSEEMGIPGATSYNELANSYRHVCAEHLAEYIAVAIDGVTGIERFSVRAPDFGKAHVIAESLAEGVRYQ